MQVAAARRLRTINQSAEKLCISRASIYRLHQAGLLPFVKLAGRTLVDDVDIDALIEVQKKRAA
jgi:predicted DNA-binding transcriptional regulator AlpA